MLSLSKYERTLQIMNGFSNPDSFFESFFNPYPSTSFLRQAQDGAGRTDWKGVLRQASFDRLRTEQGE
ncbi:MAG: hypothetical protein LBD67_02130 [Candidatus Accumulibacter sp.]|nr:hypothetical protein [Accumulibacter sp.]